MSLQHIPLDKISADDLRKLISEKVPESQYLDYKQETYGTTDKGRFEFLADVSSFANTLGGDLVIGIAERNGDLELTPVIDNCDGVVQRLEQIYLNGRLEPRIPNIRIRAVPMENEGHVIIVRVPRSFMAPHRIKLDSNNGFWARGDTQKYELNVEQLRRMFNDAPHFAERIRNFQTERVIKINAGDTPHPMRECCKVIVHIFPVPTFADDSKANVVSVLKNESLPVLRSESMSNLRTDTTPNLDGYLRYIIGSDTIKGFKCLDYSQFFRNGIIEHTSEFLTSTEFVLEGMRESRFISTSLIKSINSLVGEYIKMPYLRARGFPVYIFLSFCNAARLTCFVPLNDGSGGGQQLGPLGREIMSFPAIRVDSHDADVPAIMQPLFNMLANAFNLEQFNT